MQQHTSSLQFGQSLAEGEALHSLGAHAQSAQTITHFDDIRFGKNSGVVLNTAQLRRGITMWFVTLVKTTTPPTKENAMKSQEVQKTAESWGVKFHNGFMTLGPYDGVWITEAPDEKTALRVAMLFNKELGGQSTTMPAVAFEEVVGWLMKM